MHTFVLQDWTTIRGTLAATSSNLASYITQNESEWLDLSPYQDVFFWVAIAEVTAPGMVSLYLETSPTEDEALFQSIAGSGTAAISGLTASATPVVLKYPMLSAAIPIARYLRWKLGCASSGPWDATMRIVVAANSPGM